MTDYITGLRQLIGRRTIIQCGASVIIENELGEILLLLRKDNRCWSYPGGSLEIDEDLEEAAKRELFEETGLRAGSIELFGVFSGKDMHYIYPNGDEVSNIDVVYICRMYTGNLLPQESEVTELKFFAIDDIPENLSPPIVKPLKEYIKYRNSYRNTMKI